MNEDGASEAVLIEWIYSNQMTDQENFSIPPVRSVILLMASNLLINQDE